MYVTHGGAKGAARELGISSRTVEHTIATIRHKWHCTTEQAIARGAGEGWIAFG